MPLPDTAQLLSPPAEEPLTLAEALAHLRLSTDADAAQITGLLRSAREAVEARTGQTLAPTRYRLELPYWPPTEEPELPHAPLLKVEAIRYLPRGHLGPAGDGAYRALAPEHYRAVERGPYGEAALRLAPPPVLPPLHSHRAAVRIDYLSGYAPQRLPGPLRMAILLLLRDLYDHIPERNAALESLILSHRASGFAG